MADCMDFPNDWAKFLEDYSFRDHKEIYTNGARLIPVFRVEQMMHHYLRKATENAVPVVRCKDCRFYEEAESSLIGKVMCCTGQGDVRIQKQANDFCSYGERRAGE